MANTIIIGGVSRTGKSRLAEKIFLNTKATVFHGDHMINALQNSFSEKKLISKVLVKVIRNMGNEFNYTRIFESCHINPVWAEKRLNYPDYIFLFLGYPRVNVAKKLYELRLYGASHPLCWTNQHNDESLIKWIEYFVNISRKQEQQCFQLGLPYFDTSEDFLTTWNKAYNYVMNKLTESK